MRGLGASSVNMSSNWLAPVSRSASKDEPWGTLRWTGERSLASLSPNNPTPLAIPWLAATTHAGGGGTSRARCARGSASGVWLMASRGRFTFRVAPLRQRPSWRTRNRNPRSAQSKDIAARQYVYSGAPHRCIPAVAGVARRRSLGATPIHRDREQWEDNEDADAVRRGCSPTLVRQGVVFGSRRGGS